MDTIETLVLAFHVLAALAIIGLILIQHGKGADMGSGFGAGASATVFGSGGASSFLTRLTTGIAIAFFLSSFGLAYFAKERSKTINELGIPQLTEQVEVADPASEESAISELPEFDEADAAEVPSMDAVESEVPEQ